jgi:mannose-6-phosphate isomerase-like protein (cupin superfamily)
MLEKGEQFLIREYDQFWLHNRHVEDEIKNYFHFFILLIAGLISLITVLIRFTIGLEEGFSTDKFIEIFKSNDLIALTIYTLIGICLVYGTLLIFIEIKFRYECISHMWQLNSIRRYFLERKPELSSYIQFEVREGPKNLKSSFTLFLLLIISSVNSVLLTFLTLFIIITFKKIDILNSGYIALPIFLSVYVALVFVKLHFNDLRLRNKIKHEIPIEYLSILKSNQESTIDMGKIELIKPKSKKRNSEIRKYFLDKKKLLLDYIITESDKKHKQEVHRHKKNIEKTIVLDGEIIVHCDRKKIRLRKNQGIIVPPNIWRTIEFPTNLYTRFITIKSHPGEDDKILQ